MIAVSAQADDLTDCAELNADPRFQEIIETQNQLNAIIEKTEAQISAKDYQDALKFLGTLPKEKKNRVLQLLKAYRKSKAGFVEIPGTGTPIILVHGMGDMDQFPFHWAKPLTRALDTKRPVLLFRWSQFGIMRNTEKLLENKVHKLVKDGKDVEIIGYSAGGDISLLALEGMAKSGDSAHVQLHTIASPMYGYGATLASYVASPFVGPTTIQIGRGIRADIQHHFDCTHWINTNCDLDIHACKRTDVSQSPEFGPDMPCGTKKFFKDETHRSILDRATAEIFKTR